MSKKIVTFFSILALVFAQKALAVCPVCTIAVGAGVGLTRYLGIDDVISGLWIGGLTMSMVAWTMTWLVSKKIKFPGMYWVNLFGYYALIIVPLYFMKNIWHPFNQLWGVNKLLLGIILGSIVFIGISKLYEYLKKKNHGRAHFPYQKVVMPIGSLLLLSLIFYFITK